MSQKVKQSDIDKIKYQNNSQNNNDAPIIEDERFKNIHSDPRFAVMTKKDKKVKVDKRFESIFTDDKFKISSQVDKFGRQIQVPKINKEMQQLYYRSDEDSDEKKSIKKKQNQNDQVQQKLLKKQIKQNDKQTSDNQNVKQKKSKVNKQSSSDEQDNRKKNNNVNQKKNRKQESSDDEGPKPFEWNEVSSNEDEDFIMDDDEGDDEWEGEIINGEKVLTTENSSCTLAVVNYDWTHLKAADLMILFNSFIRKEGEIKQVRVYLSDFGKEQMKIENEMGPQNVWKDGKEIDENYYDEDDYESDNHEKKPNKKVKVEQEINEWIARDDDENNALDAKKLRKYEKERLRYYYAILECDSSATAEQLYDSMDGLEFELTSMKIDLRIVPNGQTFPNDPSEVCNEVPSGYKVNNFLNRSLNHTNVKLTWDEPKTDRFNLKLMVRLSFINEKLLKSDDAMNRIDWSQYVDCESDDEDNENKKDLWNNTKVTKVSNPDFDKSKRNKGFDMEISFNPAFDDLGNTILEKQEQKNEQKDSVWERYQKKKKNQKEIGKKQRQLQKINQNFLIDDEELKKHQQELELLIDSKKDKQEFRANVNDSRFNAIYDSEKFAIDPTYKGYKPQQDKFFKEQINRRKKNRQNE